MSPESRRTLRRSVNVLGLAAAALLVLTAGVVSAGGKPKPPPPPPQPSNPAIAFTLDNQVCVMDADGSNITLVAAESDSGASCTAVDWSHDGTWLVWSAFTSGSPAYHIKRAGLDGSGPTVLFERDGYKYCYPRWSPGDVLGKGEKIAFGASYVDPNDGVYKTHLFLMDTDGGDPVDLTEASGAPGLILPGHLAWSPGADHLAGVDEQGHLVVFQLGLVDGDIQIVGMRDITEEAAGGLDYLSGDPIGLGPIDWANTPANSSKLVIRYCHPDPLEPWSGMHVYVLDLASYEVTPLTATPDDAHHTTGGVAWSPDDKQVAVAFPMGYQKWQKLAGLWTIRLLNLQRTQLLTGQAGYGPNSVEWWAGATQ
jgi:hypothetical protein